MRLASFLESKQSRRFAELLVSRRRLLGLLLYVVGVAYLLLLPRDEFNRRSFIDENALMVGLVKREFTDAVSLSQYTSSLEEVYSNRDEVLDLIVNQFTGLGLEVYRQNFTAKRPAIFGSQKVDVTGYNVYAVLRAAQSSSTEALVLSAPYPPSEEKTNLHGLALMLTLADYFRGKNYWAKDIIFLVTVEAEIGTQAWIDGYVGTQTKGIAAEPLPGRSGAIQAVINLEVSSSSIDYADVIIEGVNGILPNLDLVHVVTHSSESEGIPSSFHVQWETSRYMRKPAMSPYLLYLNQLQTVASIVAHQAPGLPLASHALFLRHRIDSLTVRSSGGGGKDSKSVLILARALESSFRSLNNLLERLHHSEFFYYTPSRGRFISIGQFMPALGLLLAPLVLELAQWLLARGLAERKRSSEEETTIKELQPIPPFPFQPVLSLFLGSFLSGLLLLCLPQAASQLQSPLQVSGLLTSLAWGSCLSIFIPLMSSTTVTPHTWHMTKCLSLILQLLLLIALGIMNFALSALLCLSLPLPALLSLPHSSSSKLRHKLGQLLLLLSSPPLTSLLLCCLYYALFIINTPASSQPEVGGVSLEVGVASLMGGALLFSKGLVLAYTSWYFVSSWLFPVVLLCVWPVWLMGWILSCQTLAGEEEGIGGGGGGGAKGAPSSSSSSSHPHTVTPSHPHPHSD